MALQLSLNLRLGMSAIDHDANQYITAIEQRDGEVLEASIKAAIITLVSDLKAANLWSRIHTLVCPIGARTLSGALVPLKGTAPTNVSFVSSDYDRRGGLRGGTGKYLVSNTNPATTDQNDCSYGVWVVSPPTLTATYAYMGTPASTAGTVCILSTNADQFAFRLKSADSRNYPGVTTAFGFIGMSRSSGANFTVRFNSVSQNALLPSDGNQTESLDIFRRSAGNPTDARLSMYVLGQSIDMAAFEAVMDKYMTAIHLTDPNTLQYLSNVEASDGQALEPAARGTVAKLVTRLKCSDSPLASVSNWAAIGNMGLFNVARTLPGSLRTLKGVDTSNVNFSTADYTRGFGLKSRVGAYINLNTNINAYAQNNFSMGVDIRVKQDTTVGHIGAGDTGENGASRIGADISSVFFRCRTPNATSIGHAAQTGIVACSRNNDPTAFISHIDGIENTASVASSTPPNKNAWFMQANGTTAGADSTRVASMYWMGNAVHMQRFRAVYEQYRIDLAGSI